MHAWVEHTAELQLELEAPTREEVFAEAFVALRELLADAGEGGGEGEGGGRGEVVERRVEADAGDLPALLAEWLQELVFLVESEGLVPEELAGLELGEGRVAGTVRGRRGAPPPLVKAVTYHDLRLAREGGRWRGRVVLDV
jgi:SHS2 domain-containing protein